MTSASLVNSYVNILNIKIGIIFSHQILLSIEAGLRVIKNQTSRCFKSLMILLIIDDYIGKK